ncbi:MAG: 30S ribosomal protein S17 [Candidatus Dojkabacteria bacterium]
MANTNKELNTRKIKRGVIVNLNSGIDTIKVELERKLAHSMYEKQVKFNKTYLVHLPESEKEKFQLGQEVKIAQTRPISKSKSWEVVK